MRARLCTLVLVFALVHEGVVGGHPLLTRDQILSDFPDLAPLRGFCLNDTSCLPSVHIIGVSKCGTTDIMRRLALHDDVGVTSMKGPHFWDELHTLDWYAALYPHQPGKTLIDASSNTFSYPYVRHKTHLNYTLAEVYGTLFPGVKTIVVFRDPAQRLYSAFFYYYIFERYNNTPHGFHSFVVDELDKVERAGCGFDDYRCMFSTSQQLAKSMYWFQLDGWRRNTDLLVLDADAELFTNMHTGLTKALAHIGLNYTTEWLQVVTRLDVANQRARNRGRSGDGRPMLDMTRTVLADFFTRREYGFHELTSRSTPLGHLRRR